MRQWEIEEPRCGMGRKPKEVSLASKAAFFWQETDDF